MANCTVIKTGATVTKEVSQRVTNLRQLIDDVYLPAGAQVGDVAMYDSVNDKVVFAAGDADFLVQYPSSQFTPIGVVAVPADHNRYDDGKCGVVSLKYMNYSNPDEGSASSQTMYWGNNSRLLGDALNEVVTCGTGGDASETAQGESSSAYLPSDNFANNICPTDSKAGYNSSTVTAAPSPYRESGGKNSVYSQTEEPTSDANCLADFDGVGKTQLMLNAVTVSDWQTSDTITNSYSSGNYPSACVCWRFHTKGTNQGDWYLPAMGELGYVMARLKTINATIANLIEAYGDDVAGEITTSGSHWSSTEYSSSNARYLNMSTGYVSYYYKTYDYYVRAFARL